MPTGGPSQAGLSAEAQRAEWGLCYAPVLAPRCLGQGQGQEGREEVAWQEELSGEKRRAGCGPHLPQPGHLRGPPPGAPLETPGGPEEEGGAAFRVACTLCMLGRQYTLLSLGGARPPLLSLHLPSPLAPFTQGRCDPCSFLGHEAWAQAPPASPSLAPGRWALTPRGCCIRALLRHGHPHPGRPAWRGGLASSLVTHLKRPPLHSLASQPPQLLQSPCWNLVPRLNLRICLTPRGTEGRVVSCFPVSLPRTEPGRTHSF